MRNCSGAIASIIAAEWLIKPKGFVFLHLTIEQMRI